MNRMKPLITSAVKYFQLALLFVSVSAIGVLMGEKSLNQKYFLEGKKTSLQKENIALGGELKVLERRVTLLRSDRKTIEKAAKRKLGMSQPNETVYIFDTRSLEPKHEDSLEPGLLGKYSAKTVVR